MKVLVEYHTNYNPRFRVIETREYDTDNYPKVISVVSAELHLRGNCLVRIRCLDPHPKDLV